MIMAYFNEDNVTEQMCIAVAKETGLSPACPQLSQACLKLCPKFCHKL